MSLPSAVARALAELLAPLAVAMESADNLSSLLADLGWDVQVPADDLPAVAAVLPVADDVLDLIATAEELADATSEAGELVGQIVTTASSVFELIDGLAGLSRSDLAGLVEPLDDPATWADLAAALPGYLLLEWVRGNHPLAFALLVLAGVVETIEREDGLPPSLLLSWEALGDLLTDPGGQMASVYGWGGQFDHPRLLSALGATLRAAGADAALVPLPATMADAHFGGSAPAEIQSLDTPLVDQVATGYVRLGLVVAPVPADGGDEPTGLLISHEVVGAASAEVSLGGGLTLVLDGGVEQSGALGVVVGPGGTTLAPGAAAVGASVRLESTPELARPMLGDGEGTRLELRKSVLEVAARGSAADPELVVEFSGELALVIEPADADSFVAQLLGAVSLEIPTEVALELSSTSGLTLGGQVGFQLVIPLDQSVGPVHIAALGIGVAGGRDGGSLLVTVTGSATLGPFTVTVQEIGILAALTPVAGRSGTFGSTDLTLAFKPPSGLGLAIDVGIVRGGGFLAIDPEDGTYEGVIDLEIAGVGICAVVIVDTDVPGLDGWSMFLALFIDLPSIQLGFGFTLEGVGGIAGVNRTVDPEALIAAVRAGSLDTVLFPADPIAAAPEIIAAFSAIFPVAPGRYVFGPVVQIGWGTPALVTVALGVVIELPDPILVAVLGSLTSVLPTTELDLVELHLDFSGIVDFEAGTLAIDASLHDSSVVGFALAGDMALRAAFTDAPTLVLALGGFHPGFDAPCGFPALQRLSLGISAGDIIDISFECYFALTSNTVQFGAAVELDATIEGFGVQGGMSFDTLVQFQPFSFTTSIDMHVAVTAADFELLAVRLYGSLQGPNPWRVIGTAEFEFLGFPKRIHVDERIGDARPDRAVEAPEVLDELCRLVEHDDAWAAGAPGSPSVTLAAPTLGGSGELVVAPDQTVVVSQRLVPLDTVLERFGESTGLDHERFTIDVVGSTEPSSAPVMDWFSPGQFLAMSPQEELVAPSFELYPAGLEFGGRVAGGPGRAIEQAHEQLLRDPELPELPAGMAKQLVLMSEHPAASAIAAATAATWAGAEVSFTPVAA